MTTKRVKAQNDKSWGVMVDGIEVLRDPVLACEQLAKDKVIGVDTETTGLSPWNSKIALVQLYGEQSGTLAVVQVKDGILPPPVKKLLETKKTFVAHNAVGFDLLFLNNAGLNWRNANWWDTYVGEVILESAGRHDISKSLANSLRLRLDKKVDKTIEHGKWHLDELSARQIEYAGSDVVSLPALYRNQLDRGAKTTQTEALLMEQELVPIVVEMELTGLPCTKERIKEYVKKQAIAIQEADARLHKRFGKGINLSSTQQLQAALAKEKVYVTSTNKETLIEMSQMGGKAGAIADDLMTWKHGKRRITMYSDQWITDHIFDGRIHPSFHQCAADTTRFTCTNPNLQQVPKDSRGDIVGDLDGYSIVSVDYSQIEVRIAAHIAGDRKLLSLLEKEDVHTAVAAAVFGIPEKTVDPRQRKLAKAMTFLLLFGGGASGFYKYVGMSGGQLTEDEAEQYVYQFFSTFTGLRSMRERAEEASRRPGVVSIRLPNSSRRILAGWQKKSTTILNTMVQGSAAVGIKYGMLEAAKMGLVRDRLAGQVHDELLSVVPTKQAKEYAKELEKAMLVGMNKILQGQFCKVETKIGKTWQA